MNIFETFHTAVLDALEPLLLQAGIERADVAKRFVVEPTKDAAHGDLATNVAMVLTKDLKMPPRALAEKIVASLHVHADLAAVEIAGPGFINLRLKPAVYYRVVQAILQQTDVVFPNLGRGEPVNVEYVSANPTGPMHVGHGRGAVFGDALARLLDATGHAVTREYYINDAGAQVDVLARSAYLRYREALGEAIGAIPEGLYPGDYLCAVGQALAQRFGRGLLGKAEAEWLAPVRDAAIDAMMDMIRDDLASLNIRHDVFFSERSLTSGHRDLIAEALQMMREAGHLYEGVLPRPKGAEDDEWEEREQTLFASTRFGDDVDRALKKSDGSYTYFASDIAYHRNKIERGFYNMIHVWGADHAGYIKRMQAAVHALSGGRARLEVEICQLVRLMRGGEPLKMSKRAGDFVTLREVVDEVGVDAVRFMMLFRKSDAMLDFDLTKVVEQSKDNPVFYVQYAHARCCSTLRNADVGALHDADLSLLADENELQLIKRLAQYGRVIEQATLVREPHRIAFYLYDLASDFHAHWNKGKDFPELRFIAADNAPLTLARMALVQAIAAVLRSGLGLLGVSAPEEMR